MAKAVLDTNISKRKYVDSRKINILKKAEEVKLITKKFLGDGLTTEHILHHLTRIKNFHYCPNRKINADEKELYNYLLVNDYNPQTIVSWIKSTLIPEEVMEKIRNKELTTYQALRLAKNLYDRRTANLGMEILEDTKCLINDLHKHLREKERGK